MEKPIKRRVLNCSIDPCVHTLGVEKFAEWMKTGSSVFLLPLR
jgi:hypothetical protein